MTMKFTWVLFLGAVLALAVAQDDTTEDTTVPPKKPTESNIPGPVRPKPFLGFGGKFPYQFDADRAKAEIPEFEMILRNIGSLWNTISGLVGIVTNTFKSKGRGKEGRTTPNMQEGNY